MSNQKQIDAIVEALADVVEIIEGLPMTTQNHYGDYLAILGRYKTKKEIQTIGVLMLKAGANWHGVSSALKVLGAMS